MIILLFLTNNFLISQTPVYPYNTDPFDVEDGAYIKDIDGLLDYYVGTWEYDNGTISYTIELSIINQYHAEIGDILNIYKDEIVGNVRYTVNGNEIYNTFQKQIQNICQYLEPLVLVLIGLYYILMILLVIMPMVI